MKYVIGIKSIIHRNRIEPKTQYLFPGDDTILVKSGHVTQRKIGYGESLKIEFPLLETSFTDLHYPIFGEFAHSGLTEDSFAARNLPPHRPAENTIVNSPSIIENSLILKFIKDDDGYVQMCVDMLILGGAGKIETIVVEVNDKLEALTALILVDCKFQNNKRTLDTSSLEVVSKKIMYRNLREDHTSLSLPTIVDVMKSWRS